jgi:predicted PurR-regulated permease PerM
MSTEKQVVVVLGWASLGVLAYLAWVVIGPFAAPLGWAAVFAIVAHPVYRRLEPVWGRGGAALAGTAVVALAVVVPAVAVTTVIAAEAIDASASLQRALADGRLSNLAQSWTAMVERLIGDGVDVSQAVADVVKRGAETLVSWSGVALRDAFVFGVNIAIALFATFFVLRDSAAIMTVVRRILPMPPSLREAMIIRVHDLVSVGVSASVVVAATQGVLGGAAFWLLDLPSPAFWGVVMGLLCLLPFGAWLVWLPAAAALAFDGHTGRAIALAAMGVGVVSGVDNVLRPALVSGRTHMHGLVILVGLLGGAAAWGALGLVIGPVVVAATLALLNAYVEAAAEPAPGAPLPGRGEMRT